MTSWQHLIYIHIEKCAGTNFVEPFSRMMKYIESKSLVAERYSNTAYMHYLWHGNLGNKYMHDAYLLEAFQGKELYDLQGSFLANHGAKHGIYDQHLKKAGISAKKISLLRDPSQRLYSHIRHYGRLESDKKVLISKYSREFYNLMDRYIYDYDLFYDNKSPSPPHHNPTDYKKCDTIDFLDISDNNAISKIKSSILSATLLPNIVQHNRLNDDNDKTRRGMLREEDFQEIHQELISSGFIDRDVQLDMESLKMKTKKRLVFPSIIEKGSFLHPITFILPRNSNAKTMLTKDFIADPLNAINS